MRTHIHLNLIDLITKYIASTKSDGNFRRVDELNLDNLPHKENESDRMGTWLLL